MSLAEFEKYLWRPYSQPQIESAPLHITGTKGAYLFTEEGRAILDGCSSWWTNLHGHSDPHIIERLTALIPKMQHVIFAGTTHRPAAELAQKLIQTLGAPYQRIFYSDDGSTAVEAALKIAGEVFRRKFGEKKRPVFVALEGGYHGDTFGAMCASSSGLSHPSFLGKSEVRTLSFSNPVAEFEAILQTEKVCGIILEPVLQGAVGMRIYPVEVVEKLFELAKKHQVISIADEVFTGFYRTGYFGKGMVTVSQRLRNKPDIITLSKALTNGVLPLGVTVTTEELYQNFATNNRSDMFLHGHSFTANPIVCTAAVASLEIAESPEFEPRILEHLSWVKKFAQRLSKELPAECNVRNSGMIVALEVTPELAKKIGVQDSEINSGYFASAIREKLYRQFLAKNVLIRPLGNTLYFLPSLAHDLAGKELLETTALSVVKSL